MTMSRKQGISGFAQQQGKGRGRWQNGGYAFGTQGCEKKRLAWLQKSSQRYKELLPEHLIGFEITNLKRFLAVYRREKSTSSANGDIQHTGGYTNDKTWALTYYLLWLVIPSLSRQCVFLSLFLGGDCPKTYQDSEQLIMVVHPTSRVINSKYRMNQKLSRTQIKKY